MHSATPRAVAVFLAFGCAGQPSRPVSPTSTQPTAAPRPSLAQSVHETPIPNVNQTPAKSTTLPLGTTGDAAIDAALSAGDAAFDDQKFDEAERSYRRGLALRPACPEARVGLARLRIAKTGLALDYGAGTGNKEVLAAAAELRDVTEKAPDLGAGLAELGGAFLILGQAKQGVAALRRAAQLLPDQPEVHSMLGVALLATGEREAALPELQRAATLDPERAERHGNLGTILLIQGRVDDAIREYETQAKLADGDARAHSDLGVSLLQTSDVSRAVRELERAVALDATRASYHSNLGYAYQRSNRLPEAIAQYRSALKIDDHLAGAWINLATALGRDASTRAEAGAALEKARALDPTDPNVKANLDELDALSRQPKPTQKR